MQYFFKTREGGILKLHEFIAQADEVARAFGLPDDCPIMLPVDERCRVW